MLLGAWKVAEGLTRREEFGGLLAQEGDGTEPGAVRRPAKRSGTVEMRLGSVGVWVSWGVHAIIHLSGPDESVGEGEG